MIIWRGLGFLAVLVGLLGVLIGVGLSSLAGEETSGPLMGLGMLLGGAGVFALGWYLNVVNPAKKAQTWTEQRRAELQHAVATGQFQPAPGIAPASRQEAEVQAQLMLDAESTHVTKRLRNIHTLFWIPMQWWGVVWAVVGVVVAITLLSAG